MSIQVYGQFHDYCSFSTVSRAIVNELVRKRFDVTIFGVNSLSPQYFGVRADVGLRNTANTGIFIGYPEGSIGWLFGHANKVLVTVCETDRIPQSWVDACNFADLVIVPSRWCEDAFKRSGVFKPTLIVHHGIYAETATFVRETIKKDSDSDISKQYLLHVSGSLTFAARKGTSKLLRVFKRISDIRGDLCPKLYLKMPNTSGVKRALDSLDLGSKVTLLTDQSLSPIDMYTLCRKALAVVQPSRAEGFGIVPLEARSVGTPVILTNVTGHAEHFADGVDTLVPATDLNYPLETQANPVGGAPVFTEDALYKVVNTFLDKVEWANADVSSWANSHAARFNWQEVLTPLVRRLKLSHETRRTKLGGNSSLRGLE